MAECAATMFDAFPTCVGMNRDSTTLPFLNCCVPHVRGDEPYVAAGA